MKKLSGSAYFFALMVAATLLGCCAVSHIDSNDMTDCTLNVSELKNIVSDDAAGALRESIAYLSKQRADTVHIGEIALSRESLVNAQNKLLDQIIQSQSALLSDANSKDFILLKLQLYVQNHFQCVSPPRTSFFTGYYTPSIRGSLTKSSEYPYPIYGLPLDPTKYSRHEIDREGRLVAETSPVLAYTDDDIALFFLQIQGSGFIKFSDGTSKLLSYAGKNGFPYRAIGKTLKEMGLLPDGPITMQSITATLKDNPTVKDQVLDSNPSYVFFNLENTIPHGNLGIPVIEKRSYAADQRIFSGGTFALVSVPISGTERLSQQLMFTHDIGGAIRGERRFDIYFGSEPGIADKLAGNMQNTGIIQFLVPR